jgi:hypothetical protein
VTQAAPLHIRQARVWDGAKATARDLYTAGERVVARPAPGALALGLDGCTVFPGCINAHDHLELNHYPRTKFRAAYDSAHQWGEDVSARLDGAPFAALRAWPLWARVFIGGLKNLLCGATTVMQHGPPHKPLYRRDFPVRVLKAYGWAHSLHFSADADIVRSYRRTPSDWPWFIHLAEGTDADAAGEYQRLKALGCVGANTVIVHGVGLTAADIADAAPRIRALVWCPTTNRYLLNADAPVRQWLAAGGRLWLGSDSRLTADDDLLAEYQQAARTLPGAALTPDCAETGHLRPGAYADWFAAAQFPRTRADIALVVRGGIPQLGDPALMRQFPHIPTVRAALDGAEKRIHTGLARQLGRCGLPEPGLEVDTVPAVKRFFWH